MKTKAMGDFITAVRESVLRKLSAFIWLEIRPSGILSEHSVLGPS